MKIFIILILLANICFAKTLETTVSQSTLTQNESVQIIFKLSDMQDIEKITPDFTGLSINFNIMSSRRETNISWLNGKKTASMTWFLTVMPKKSGVLKIPGIQFGSEESKPFQLQVSMIENKAKQSITQKQVFLKSHISTTHPYVQGEVIYTVRIYYTTHIFKSRLSPPEAQDAVVMRIGQDKMISQELHNEQLYQVLERSYAIFPQKSGELIITSSVFTGLIEEKPENTNQQIFYLRAKTIYLTDEPITINVKPLNYLPAKNIVLTEQWSIEKNKPVTRKIKITALGLTAEQIPALDFKINHFKQYPEKPTFHNQLQNNSVLGIRTEKIVYIPQKSGVIQVPDIQITYWNTLKNKLEQAILPGREINLSPPPKVLNIPQLSVQSSWPFFLIWIFTGFIGFIIIALILFKKYTKPQNPMLLKQELLKFSKTLNLNNLTELAAFILAKNSKYTELSELIIKLEKYLYAKPDELLSYWNRLSTKRLYKLFYQWKKSFKRQKISKKNKLSDLY